MDYKISKEAVKELIEVLRQRYKKASKNEKTLILNEYISLAGCHRKHAIRLLGNGHTTNSNPQSIGRRVYDEAVKEALIITWEAADRICGKRLKAILPFLIKSMERHNHLDLDLEVRERLLSISAATIDRLLAPIRSKARGRKKRKASPKKVSKQIPIRTFADWDQVTPGYLEIDFVAHCGGSMAGVFIHSLVATDVCSGWTESVPLLAREQSLVTRGLEVIRKQLPFPLLGINSDNDSAFINDTLVSYCNKRFIDFTRSRAYRKNDQAWIEQKNGAVIRRLVGHERFSGVVAGQALARLYQASRLYVNYFQPSFKLRKKTRVGSKVRKLYFKPATPCDRLLEHHAVDGQTKEALMSERTQLDPVELLHSIRDSQAALASLGSPDQMGVKDRQNLNEFLAGLSHLWRLGEARPTHRKPLSTPRQWRTRKDPFEMVWPEILLWLQAEPDATAKSLFLRLCRKYPGQFQDGQLRTLQRRIRQWRTVMAKDLVYTCLDNNDGIKEIAAIGVGNGGGSW